MMAARAPAKKPLKRVAPKKPVKKPVKKVVKKVAPKKVVKRAAPAKKVVKKAVAKKPIKRVVGRKSNKQAGKLAEGQVGLLGGRALREEIPFFLNQAGTALGDYGGGNGQVLFSPTFLAAAVLWIGILLRYVL